VGFHSLSQRIVRDVVRHTHEIHRDEKNAAAVLVDDRGLRVQRSDRKQLVPL
jgi:16S rRNA C1402 N4-methylase RsmH